MKEIDCPQIEINYAQILSGLWLYHLFYVHIVCMYYG